MFGGRSACVLCVETCARECTCPVSVSHNSASLLSLFLTFAYCQKYTLLSSCSQ